MSCRQLYKPIEYDRLLAAMEIMTIITETVQDISLDINTHFINEQMSGTHPLQELLLLQQSQPQELRINAKDTKE